MIQHLQECWNTVVSDPTVSCICDELRDCEARVIAAAVQRVEAMPFSMLDKHDRLYAVEQVIDAIKEGQD